ncbi:MAG: gamma-glutamyltransferase family protein [Ramlibacter sp.]|nr:gamma-glutamyltransferase family protein [Ramlibacter sp.]
MPLRTRLVRIDRTVRLPIWLAALLIAGCATPDASAPGTSVAARQSPEAASGYTSKPGWSTSRFAVAAANPIATRAGYDILQAGGSALDAAIAVQLVLGLVEPQSSGIGGGAFLLYDNGQQLQAWDGRETAPAAATDSLFLKADGQPMAFHEAVVGGRSVGVPGLLPMLEQAHRQHGVLPWSRLFDPAIRLAELGFAISPRLHTLLSSERYLASNDAVAARYFYDAGGQPLPVGHLLRNPEYAAVLRALASQGASALQQGPWARAVVDKVQQHPGNPGQLSLQDLAQYQPLQRDPLCFNYQAQQQGYFICGMPPPSSGTLAIGQILGILDHTRAAQLPLQQGVPSASWLHLYTEASRLAFADRAQYVADPDFVSAPGNSWLSMFDPAYLRQRASLIASEGASMQAAQPGRPGSIRLAHANMPPQLEYGTSHISIIDAQGRALSMTSSIEDQFGSRLMVNRGQGLAGGFLLNNQLTDFSFTPVDAQGRAVANRVQPGKRPRSSMAPILIYRQQADGSRGPLLMTAGSPGGSLIIHYVSKILYGTLHWGLDTQQAIALPNFGSTNGPTLLEQGRFPAATVNALRTHGAEIREMPMTSGLQAIMRTPGGYFGGADPRREGIVMGE